MASSGPQVLVLAPVPGTADQQQWHTVQEAGVGVGGLLLWDMLALFFAAMYVKWPFKHRF